MIISIKDDFDPYKIMNSGQCFRVCDEGCGKYRFISGKKVLYVKECKGGYGNVREYDVSCPKDDWEGVWKNYFDMDTDYGKIRSKIPKDDPFLRKCADAGAGIRILNQDKWEMIVSFIISQRKSIPAIRSCIEKLCTGFGERISKDIYAFPTPEALYNASEKALGECGLGYRTPYIIDASSKVFLKEIDPEGMSELTDAELFDELKTIKGVGDKVANCVMLFGYHRIGRAPVDTWIAKVIEQKYNGMNPFERYGNAAGIMQQYMFYGSAALKML